MLWTLKRAFSSVLLIVFASALGRAEELYVYNQSIRQNGMGGVYVFDPSDASGFLQNPAYSCYSSGINWTILDLNFGVNGLTVYNKIQDAGPINGIEDLDSFYGTEINLATNGHATMMLPCFGFSGWTANYTNILLHNPAFPNIEVKLIKDYAFQIGGGFRLNENTSVGFAVKRVVRAGGEEAIGANTIGNIDQDALLSALDNEGVGFGADIGIASRAKDKAFNPTVSLVWRDIGTMQFSNTVGTGAIPTQKDNLTLGLTFSEDIPLAGISGGMEVRHILDTTEQIGKKIHLGTEVSLASFDLRAGFYQGYTTYGLGFDLWLMQIDLASYTVETGAYPGQTPSERVQFSLMFDLSFDPNFKLMEINSKKMRKLKRRR